MSYGHGKSHKTHDFRAVSLAVGKLTAAKAAALAVLRKQCLATLTRMGEAAHCPEPLLGTSGQDELTKRLLVEQKATEGLNSAYAERCRIIVAAAVSNQNSKYFRQLIGRLRNAGSEIPEAERKPDAAGLVRRYYYVPPALSILPADLAALAEKGDLPFPEVTALFKRVALDKDDTGLTQAQAAVIREIHRQVIERHGKASFGDASTTVALALQYTVLPSTDRDLAQRVDAEIDALLLRDQENAKYKFFLSISAPEPRGERIHLPLSISKRMLHRLQKAEGKAFTANSFTLELGPNGAVAVRLVVAQPKAPPTPLTEIGYILSRDFGYKNTISLSLTRLDEVLDEAKIAQIQDFTKEQSKAFLESHITREDPRVSVRYMFSGKPFLDRINVHAAKIDQLRSRIDLEYQALFNEKVLLAAELGLVPDAEGNLPFIDKHDIPRRHPCYGRVQAFLGALGRINSLKINQRALYQKISELKKHWFGFLSNLETQLALQWQAVVVREDLTNVTEEKDSPGYKGRAFNKMINHGSRGQFARRASAKFQWNGVPEVALPSYYTSTTCVRHALVSKKQRKGDWFTCPHCREEGRPREHADAHAADTLGAYLLLRPVLHVTPTDS